MPLPNLLQKTERPGERRVGNTPRTPRSTAAACNAQFSLGPKTQAQRYWLNRSISHEAPRARGSRSGMACTGHRLRRGPALHQVHEEREDKHLHANEADVLPEQARRDLRCAAVQRGGDGDDVV
eukprot:EG_transcript_38762